LTQLAIRISRVSLTTADIPLPQYATEGSAGMDLCAAVAGDIAIQPGETVLIPTGFSIELPAGYEAQIRPRSGLAVKHQVGILNSPGTIDSDYRGEIKVILTNFGKNFFTVKKGDRIAQMVIGSYTKISWNEVDSLSETTRGAGGFGHTGTK
jgi:dUTP pyrophosphatase